MEVADRIVAELGIEHFFNIQLVGDHVIEINPRISTIVYQEDLNLPYLGVKRALGEISDEELVALRSRIRPGRTALRYFDQVEWDERARSGTRRRRRGPARRGGAVGRCHVKRPLRVVHCPVNTAGVPWTNVQALRRRGVDATLVVFNRYALHPEADWSLERRGGLLAPPARAVAGARGAAPAHRRLPLHFGLTLVPQSLQFPLLRAVRQAVGDALPRLGHPRQDARGARVRQEGRRRDRRQLRRDPLGAGGARDPARHRPRRDPPGAAVRPHAAARRPRAVVTPPQGHRPRDRAPARASTSTSGSSRGSTTTRRSRATATPTSSSTSSTPAGTGSSRSSAWRSASRSSRSSTTRRSGAPRRPTACACRS